MVHPLCGFEEPKSGLPLEVSLSLWSHLVQPQLDFLAADMRWYINRMIFNSIESLSSWFDKRLSIHFVIRSAAIVHEFVHRLSKSFCHV